MRLKTLTAISVILAAAAIAAAPVTAETRKHELSDKDSFSDADAIKGQAYVTAAMTTPMMDLLSKADVNHPDVMLEYGLALDLGRTSVSQQMPKDERDKLKRGFREMLDLYLNSGDKFDITFNEDAMLDQAEFWIYLAKHVGRPDRSIDTSTSVTLGNNGADMSNVGANAFLLDDMNKKEFHLNENLILNPHVVNAATTCAESAFGFAKMRKAQLVDISSTKLTPEQYAKVQEDAVRTYRLSWAEGRMACGSEDVFNTVADFASHNLGALGDMKDSPTATLAPLNTAGDKNATPAS